MHELKLDKPRGTYCRRMARKAFRMCSSAFPEGWPTDVKLAAGMALPGFVVVELETLPKGVSAIVDIDDRSIGVNGTHNKTRQRLAAAHEMAHVFLSHPLYVFAVSGRQDAILEREADIFAQEFLVPSSTLQREFRTCRDYMALAERFGVDKETMLRRFIDTGLFGQVT